MISLRNAALSLLVPFALPAMAEVPCATRAQCNQVGTAAYQAGRFDAATHAFARQLRRVEPDDTGGYQLAVNNLALANLRAGQPGMARAWLSLALQDNQADKATLHNLAKVTQALDYQGLSASPVGRYVRYEGQAVWSELEIRQEAGVYRASFWPVRLSASVEEYGPVALGELEGVLVGGTVQMRLEEAGLGADCGVQLLREGIELRVLEIFAGGCQEYGGMGISVGGRYIKVASEGRP
ncbi:MAG TPA: tetratricopeptide repeat protein [Pseudomonas sp.]|nr:tetratricopeptide repeat protein [Pseudomonas sp.]